jgi:acetate kinase
MHVLTINSGSSSLKFSLYEMGPGETAVLSGSMERIGLRGGRFRARDAAGNSLADAQPQLPDHDAALKMLLDWLHEREKGDRVPSGCHLPERPGGGHPLGVAQMGTVPFFLSAVGHRVVHGGPRHSRPEIVTADLLAALEENVRLAPAHLPHELQAIRAVERHYPGLAQVACFDTAFHRHMPEVAQRFPLARSLWHEGVLRYGFHGLSYEYIMDKLRQEAGAEADGRVIVAHLGNGASMAAVRAGQCLDTTMGLTPAGGLMMGTRSGDLDPGVLLYLLLEKGRSAATVDYLVNERAGLIGVSGTSSDMRDLLEREPSDPHAAQAVEMYCYHARKQLAALAAVLGGLDSLVFTAGVGANSAVIRERICRGLDFLGIRLDAARNQANAALIGAADSPVIVRVMKTDEELMIARHTYTEVTLVK